MLPRTSSGPRPGRRAHWRRTSVLVLLAAAGGGLAGAAWGAGQAATHEATAVVVLNPLEGNPFSPEGRGDDLVNLETEAQLVRSSTMGALAARELGTGADPADLVGSVSVTVPPNTQLLEITAQGADDPAATAVAQAFADSYLQYRSARTEATRFDRAAQLEEQIRERTHEQEELVADLGDAPENSGRAAVLTQRIVNLTQQVDELRAQLAATGTSAPDPGQLVTPATTSAKGLPGGPRTALVAGLLLGAVGGWLVAAAANRLDGVIRSAEDLADSDLPVLASVPHASSPTDDARLRSALLASTERRPLTVLVSAPAAAGLGPRTGYRLAESAASAHVRTVVVDVSATDGHGTGTGLSDLLADQTTLDRALARRSTHLTVLTAGSRPAALDDLAASPEAAGLLEELRSRADLVVVCCPGPEHQVTQALTVRADLVLLEAHEGHTRRLDLVLAAELLATVGGQDVRAVLVGPERHAHSTVRTPLRQRVRVSLPASVRRHLARGVLGPLARHGGRT